jgi:CheY-specific phosphatase CheX
VKVNINTKPKWISKGLKVSTKNKRKIMLNFYKTKTLENKIKYTKYTKLLKKCIVLAQKTANSKFIRKSKNICKASWKVVKAEVNNTQESGVIDILAINGNNITQPSQVAEALNDYFIQSTNILNHNTARTLDMGTSISNSIFLMPFSDHEVLKVITTLNNTHAEGFDEISTKVIKECKFELVTVLTYLINLSLQTGNFPEKLKISIVKPVYKKGEKTDIVNYRPITLVPILSKIFEKAMHKR